MNYLFDTNILLHYLRASKVKQLIDTNFKPFNSDNNSIISVVSIGEIISLSLQNQWGIKKMKTLDHLLSLFVIADIHADDIIQRYAEIDAYSQGRLSTLPSQHSARNMGKNDIWIAASASVLSATLLTTDKDFDHLKETFIDLQTISITSD